MAGDGVLTMSANTSTQISNQKASRKKKTRHQRTLDRGSCEKLPKKLTFAEPVFIISGIFACTGMTKCY